MIWNPPSIDVAEVAEAVEVVEADVSVPIVELTPEPERTTDITVDAGFQLRNWIARQFARITITRR